MQAQPTHQKLALGILVVCLLALVVGVFNSSQVSPLKNAANKTADVPVTSLLGHKDNLLLLELVGPIMMDNPQQAGFFESGTNAMMVRKALDEAAEDKSVKGVLLRINSPGGTVGMSQELNAAVQRVSKVKPVVASLGDLAASGGFYTAVACDKIVANPGTLSGSIGVIISTLNMTDLFNNKLGVESITVRSGKFKDLFNPYRKVRPDEIALVQKLIDDSYQDFLGAVVSGRTRFIKDQTRKSERIAAIKAVADGRVLHSAEAKKAGLIDDIGDLDYAYTVLDQMAKERFGLKGTDRLPLEELDNSLNLMSVLGLGAQMIQKPQPSVVDAYVKAIPLSMKLPNQPLWILE